MRQISQTIAFLNLILDHENILKWICVKKLLLLHHSIFEQIKKKKMPQEQEGLESVNKVR